MKLLRLYHYFQIEKTRIKGTPYELEINIIRDNNEIGWLWAKGEVAKNEDNKTIGLRGSAQDITEIKNNENALIYAKKQAEASELANRHKNYFLAKDLSYFMKIFIQIFLDKRIITGIKTTSVATMAIKDVFKSLPINKSV